MIRKPWSGYCDRWSETGSFSGQFAVLTITEANSPALALFSRNSSVGLRDVFSCLPRAGKLRADDVSQFLSLLLCLLAQLPDKSVQSFESELCRVKGCGRQASKRLRQRFRLEGVEFVQFPALHKFGEK
jgi:hypothetical protein